MRRDGFGKDDIGDKKVMTPNELLILNLEEVRRRSVILWRSLPASHYFWKPDDEAMHALEMIRHVLAAEYYLHYIIVNKGDTSQFPDLDVLPYTDLQAEFDRAKPWREHLFADIRSYTVEELDNVDVVYGKRAPRKLGDFILRIGYHEAVHAGNFISYMRAMGLERPWVWD